MDTLAFWTATSANAASAGLLMVHYRHKVRAGLMDDRRAKWLYSWWCPAIGISAAVTIFCAIAVSLKVPIGHGEILVAVPMFNAGLSLVLLLLGRMIIAWKPLRW